MPKAYKVTKRTVFFDKKNPKTVCKRSFKNR